MENPKTSSYQLFYTYSGADPRQKGKRLKNEGFKLEQQTGQSVSVYTVRMAAKYSNGTWSDIFTHSYFIGTAVNSRFDLNVFSIAIAPDDFTGENGIYKNPLEEGREWEKPIHVEYLSSKGEVLFSQDAGMRIHGGWTRKRDMKSYRLYSREEYGKKKFNYPIFDNAVDAYGEPITSYKRLVLRNSGNDMNVTWMRNELAARLARQAGFPDSEESRPVALFINGEYQGMYWVEEFVSEKYFENTYGKYDGTMEKSDHKEEAVDTKEENLEFLDLAALDLTKEENYKQVTDQIDVENYLFYYAINTVLDNEDWPQTNSISYHYIAGESGYTPGTVFDGRWRFLIHDVDLSLRSKSNHISTECLKCILDDTAVKHHSETLDLLSYSPLFAALMKREDCRTYYIKKVQELIHGAFTKENMLKEIEEISMMQRNELKHYYQECKFAGKNKYEEYLSKLGTLKEYAGKCQENIAKQIEDLWGVNVR